MMSGAEFVSAQQKSIESQLAGVFDAMSGEQSSASQKRNDIDFDTILGAFETAENTGNSGDINFDALLNGFGNNIDFDLISSSMTGDLELGITESERLLINRTLDYMGRNNSYGSGYYDSFYSSYETEITLPGIAVLPIKGILTSHFGYRPKYGRKHKGVDIALSVGDTICASMTGMVSRVDNEPRGYGLFVVISHNDGWETRYAHLSQSLVMPGMRVRTGQPIALGGSTGNSTGPHLHFETRLNNEAIDPTTLFDFTKGSTPDLYDYADTDPYGMRGASANSSGNTYYRTTYVVRYGDTLSSVSKATGVSILKLCNLNMLATTDPLEPGRMLRLH